uniref:ShKT domain-containing protein n=1 Tax=Haemonchus contortus TaxID=6289 RepID=A0A7I5ECY4_HAECO
MRIIFFVLGILVAIASAGQKPICTDYAGKDVGPNWCESVKAYCNTKDEDQRRLLIGFCPKTCGIC